MGRSAVALSPLFVTILSDFRQLHSFTSACGRNLSLLAERNIRFASTIHMGTETLFSSIKSCSIRSKREDGEKAICTHDGTFHCDEALACAMLKSLPEWRGAPIIRTRNPTVIDSSDIVVDVGGKYDPSKLRFDHHQQSFSETMSEYDGNTRLSSAGLIFRHYGLEFITCVTENRVSSDLIAGTLLKKVYKNFIEEIDGVDNGINPFDGAPLYVVSTALGSRISRLNPAWNEDRSEGAMNDRFKLAMELCLTELISYIDYLVNAWWPARSIVEASISKASQHLASAEILVLDEHCPWKEHLHEIEENQGIFGRTKFAIYKESKKEDAAWRVQAVPQSSMGFESRCLLKKEWWGRRDEELSNVAGISHCIFVHANGFIGANKNLQGAIEMAKKSLLAF